MEQGPSRHGVGPESRSAADGLALPANSVGQSGAAIGTSSSSLSRVESRPSNTSESSRRRGRGQRSSAPLRQCIVFQVDPSPCPAAKDMSLRCCGARCQRIMPAHNGKLPSEPAPRPPLSSCHLPVSAFSADSEPVASQKEPGRCVSGGLTRTGGSLAFGSGSMPSDMTARIPCHAPFAVG